MALNYLRLIKKIIYFILFYINTQFVLSKNYILFRYFVLICILDKYLFLKMDNPTMLTLVF
jgi:hypothetical protein